MIKFTSNPKKEDTYYDKSLEQRAYDQNKKDLVMENIKSANIEQKLLKDIGQINSISEISDLTYKPTTDLKGIDGEVTDVIQRRDVYVNKGNWYNN